MAPPVFPMLPAAEPGTARPQPSADGAAAQGGSFLSLLAVLTELPEAAPLMGAPLPEATLSAAPLPGTPEWPADVAGMLEPAASDDDPTVEETDEDTAALCAELLAGQLLAAPLMPPPQSARTGLSQDGGSAAPAAGLLTTASRSPAAAPLDGAAGSIGQGAASLVLMRLSEGSMLPETNAVDGSGDSRIEAAKLAADPFGAPAPAGPSAQSNAAGAAASLLAASPSDLQPPAASQITRHESVPRHLQSPVGTQAWNDELGARVTWMARNEQQSASLKLSPEHLGPLEVRITVSDDKAAVWFSAQSAETRAALGDALPRLREMFSASGLTLTDAGVSQETPRQPQASVQLARAGAHTGESAEVSEIAVRSTRLGLLDTYA